MTLAKFVRMSAVTVGALSVAVQVNAADLHSGGLKDAPVFVPPPTWTGFSVGAHVGGFWADFRHHDGNNYTLNGLDYAWSNTSNGVFGGGTVGYNFQSGGLVFGVEADFGGAGLTDDWNNGYVRTYAGRYLWVKNDASFYADVTGRLGFAAGNALFYAKGGWAYLDANLSLGGFDRAGLPWTVGASGLNGWTVGGGIEYLWSPSWSIKAEYLYFDYTNTKTDWYDTAYLGTRHFDHDLTVNSFKVGINYHFNTVYTPLK